MYCNRTQIKIKKGKKSESRIKMIRNENNFEAMVKNSVFLLLEQEGVHCTVFPACKSYLAEQMIPPLSVRIPSQENICKNVPFSLLSFFVKSTILFGSFEIWGLRQV